MRGSSMGPTVSSQLMKPAIWLTWLVSGPASSIHTFPGGRSNQALPILIFSTLFLVSVTCNCKAPFRA